MLEWLVFYCPPYLEFVHLSRKFSHHMSACTIGLTLPPVFWIWKPFIPTILNDCTIGNLLSSRFWICAPFTKILPPLERLHYWYYIPHRILILNIIHSHHFECLQNWYYTAYHILCLCTIYSNFPTMLKILNACIGFRNFTPFMLIFTSFWILTNGSLLYSPPDF